MKEKKSNLKNNTTMVDENKVTIIRLFGLFMIVYSILCFIESEPGCFMAVPFTFFVGAFTPVALLILLVAGCYMLIAKKMFNSFSVVQWVLLALIVIFSLAVASATKSNEKLTFVDSFGSYIHNTYKVRYKFLFDSETANISITQLGGGLIGYVLFGLINSMTGTNYIVSVVITSILLGGVTLIFLLPYFIKLIKWINKTIKKNKEKKALKAQEKIKNQERDAQLKKERLENSDPIDFNVETSTHRFNDVMEDDLLETTELSIQGEDFNYSRSKKEKSGKLESMLENFEDELYSANMKSTQQVINKADMTGEVKINESIYNQRKESEIDITEVFSQSDLEKNNASQNSEVVLSNLYESNPMDSNKEQITSEVVIEDYRNNTDTNAVQNEPKEQPFATPIENEVKNEEIEEKKSYGGETIINLSTFDNTKKDNDANNNVAVQFQTQPESKESENVKPYDSSNYELPPLYLLKDTTDNGANYQNEESAKEKAGILMEKMRELNVSATINAFVVGPSVTRFEISLAPGMRVGSFTNLQEDFKLALGVNSVRIESPIPGKSAIGIEVPNQMRANVSMKEIITRMPDKKDKLFVPVGKDISGAPLSFAICSMPHCLISGATNSGKSVCANTIILSILMKYKPDEVKMIMVDPKRVEMLFYKDIPHLLCPIITESEKARVALDKLCLEMDKRFTIFSMDGVKNIATYNSNMEAQGKPKMPFILLVVDEFAELMLCKNHNLVEEKIQKLAQLGRAAGIHLILSTQRPDVNVIPGTIKTNLPCRMTFRLSSLVDSRTVIDVGGAEKLLNNGDMLLLTPDFSGLRRVQGVFVSDNEINEVVQFCKKQAGPQYDENFLDLRTEEEKANDESLKYALEGNNNNASDASDQMYNDIKICVVKEQKASTSFLQRKFGIGYSKAARFIDMLEEDGIIGPENGSKPRDVLITEDELFDE